MIQVLERANIEAPVEAVWRILSELDGLERYVQAIKSSKYASAQKEGVGTTRVCEIEGFGKIAEKIVEWEDGKWFRYEVEGMPAIVRSLSNRWEVLEDGDRSIVVSTVEIDTKYGAIGRLVETLVLKKRFTDGLRRGIAQLKYYIEEGKPYKGNVDGLLGASAG